MYCRRKMPQWLPALLREASGSDQGVPDFFSRGRVQRPGRMLYIRSQQAASATGIQPESGSQEKIKLTLYRKPFTDFDRNVTIRRRAKPSRAVVIRGSPMKVNTHLRP